MTRTATEDLEFIANAAARRVVDDVSRQLRPPSAEDVARVLVRPSDAETTMRPLGEIGLTPREIRQYRVGRAVRDLAARMTPAAPGASSTPRSLEHEASIAVQKATGREFPDRIAVPIEVLTRDMTAAGSSGSNYLVGTKTAPSFIRALRAAQVTARLGAEVVGPFRESAALPRFSTSPTVTWLSDESTVIAENQPTVGSIALTPRLASARLDITHQLQRQIGSAGEAQLMREIAAAIAVAVDAAALVGSGSAGQPLGLFNVAGPGSFNGSSLTYAEALNATQDVAAGATNPDALGWACAPSTATTLAQRHKVASTFSPLWEGNAIAGSMLGARALTTASISGSQLAFGDWSNLLIAEWGVLELLADPYTAFTSGVIGLRGIWLVDVAVRHAAGFSIAGTVS